ncbi:DNA recombination protein RmuC, partial [Patescibacteria group bacterium]|nr:DNA recombination protein RmuC [Patescibacteria group bacterium]
MTTLFQIILIILVLAGFGAVIFILSKKENKDVNQDDKLKEMRDEIGKIKDEMKGSLEKNLEFIQKQSTETSKIVQDVTSKLEKLESTNKQVVDFTGQLKNLEQVLTNSKNRGSLGEAGLEMILSNILPPGNYKMQYHF